MWVALHVLNPEKWGVSVKLPMGSASYVNFQFVFLKFSHGGIFLIKNCVPLKRIKFFGQIIKNFQGVTDWYGSHAGRGQRALLTTPGRSPCSFEKFKGLRR